MRQRLKLDHAKITALAAAMRRIAQLPDPAGRVLYSARMARGLNLEKRTVPLGVLGVIVEARPDAFPQITALALKSGNALILKGGNEASRSNAAFFNILKQLEIICPWLPKGWVTLLEGRPAAQTMLRHPECIDLIIPRGSNAMVRAIQRDSEIPVLGHAAGICHLFIHRSIDRSRMQDALEVVLDAKTQYPAACNSVETLLIDASVARAVLAQLVPRCLARGVRLVACPRTLALSKARSKSIARATEKSWSTEYGLPILNVRVVRSVKEALNHISKYGSRHTDGILARDRGVIREFFENVDSATVMANASTRFADGARYGLGAEVGISTSKLHARGPVGLEGLVTTQYRLIGKYHRVEDWERMRNKKTKRKSR